MSAAVFFKPTAPPDVTSKLVTSPNGRFHAVLARIHTNPKSSAHVFCEVIRVTSVVLHLILLSGMPQGLVEPKGRGKDMSRLSVRMLFSLSHQI
jgi:hypothetical protein